MQGSGGTDAWWTCGLSRLASSLGRDDGARSSREGRRPGCSRIVNSQVRMQIVMERCPVVITGVGAATPLGSDFATCSANLLAGKSAASVVTDVQAGVEVRLPICPAEDPPVPVGWNASEFHALPR